jgi:hypothetical protein
MDEDYGVSFHFQQYFCYIVVEQDFHSDYTALQLKPFIKFTVRDFFTLHTIRQIGNTIFNMGLGLCVLCHFQQYFSKVMG